VIEKIVEPLASAGINIISGLAYGIDTLAHEAALKVSGTTVAVLGSGVDDENIFPATNRGLANKIIENGGAIISEFPIGVAPQKQNFPIRNRVIAGLCHGTLVIEATKTSGSLITARAALEDGRELFAVPGPIGYENSEGTNQLIKTGAHVVTEPNDILSVFGMNIHPLPSIVATRWDGVEVGAKPSSPAEAEIFRHLSMTPIHIDDLARLTNKKISEVSHILMLMEMKGLTRHVGGLFYTL
jgi:DNA processing protein